MEGTRGQCLLDPRHFSKINNDGYAFQHNCLISLVGIVIEVIKPFHAHSVTTFKLYSVIVKKVPWLILLIGRRIFTICS